MGSINQSKSFTAGVYRGRLPRAITAGVYRRRSPREFTAGGSMIWLAVVGTLNQSNAIIMMSLLWWGALTNQNHSPREFTTGGSMIWLAVVGTLNQSNAITMMSLLWWGALTNQNHSPREFTAGGHHGSLPWKVTAGVYRGRSPRELTAGGHHGSLPREFTTGGHCGSLPWEVTAGGSMIWLAVVGTLIQSNAIIMMSLLWWGALTNKKHSPREVTAGVYHGRFNDLIGCGGDT